MVRCKRSVYITVLPPIGDSSKCEDLIKLVNYRRWRLGKLKHRRALIACNFLVTRYKGGGGSHPDPDKRGGLVSEKVFSALCASVWSKKRGEPPPGPSPGSTTENTIKRMRPIYDILIQPSLINKGKKTLSCRTDAENPEQARCTHLACSGSQRLSNAPTKEWI